MLRFLSLVALLFALGLLASRTGLVLHEVGGHQVPAAAFGCTLGEIHLFVFGGGWVDFGCTDLDLAQALTIDLGGIALELVVGTGLVVAARRRPAGPASLAVLCVGALWIVHALFYLVTGVHYGVGDGRTLHRLLGDRRVWLVGAGTFAAVAACACFADALARRVAPRVPAASRQGRVALLATAMLAAAALHGALAWGEQRLRADPVYAASFTPEHEERIAADLRRFEQARPRTPEEVSAARRAIVAKRTPFPLRPVLGTAMGLAALAGIARALR